MGMFDSVMFACPGDETHPELEVQSKARDWPGLVNFPQDEVPYMIAADIEGTRFTAKAVAGPTSSRARSTHRLLRWL